MEVAKYWEFYNNLHACVKIVTAVLPHSTEKMAWRHTPIESQ